MLHKVDILYKHSVYNRKVTIFWFLYIVVISIWYLYITISWSPENFEGGCGGCQE